MEFYTEHQLVSPANAGFCFDFGLITAGRLLHIDKLWKTGEAKENKINESFTIIYYWNIPNYFEFKTSVTRF